MKRIIPFVFISLLFLLQTSFAIAANVPTELSPIGYWKTIDDVTGKPKAIVQIWETPNKLLSGRILKIYPEPPTQGQNEICTACEGEKHNQRIVGMVMMENFKRNEDNAKAWSGGQILDPKSGKVYHCKMEVLDNGQKLSVRGYIGVPLFGRSQIWLKVSDPGKA